ncbi:bile acid:sodium symporter family protein [Staphylococcus saprophyticus]|jgi:BASS family bile acid:Na+ symporter|uniref:bile acid:sodium symporter family protein n=1 Tax=Staphylococcus saprophyticus TaxID=29385 RepID=UPI0016423DDB|nr:bile acid:sodium symporter family protein [Staphylococcus saprophyticus]MBC2919793.1 bile acid:sodium symporter family protein [Staphylococcus saprophyticus]MBC2957081.1 bile acid:sodium symporter family protein [Staphylococcus saprophyticus]MBC3008797.1 bile acid:sodium symporter family protein [Staphylococcus saprophyticus]MBC3022112.1 bile acid:sodium symporter family protein [Staphylococcus saprophyticus]MBC3030065.1 bile acid:sodium symporter family protein [Staphylococcus saprophyticu
MLSKVSRFATNTFLVWMLIAAIIGFIFPAQLATLSGWVPYLLGIVMLGMGLTIDPKDFKIVFQSPRSVIIGVILQYTIMPLTAFLIAKLFHLPPEVAIGVILVGCCPGGTSSNVMSYLANANVALSVAITSVSTLLAPIMTPALIYLFAHEWLQVSFMSMFWSVIQVILIPILIGFILQKVFKNFAAKSGTALPIVSVVAISLILASVVGGSKSQILETGLLIFAVVILHNIVGYTLGYTLARIFKLERADKKAVSIEVGMQNSGLAVSLATVHFSPLAAVPGAVFSLVHNITGPILAKYWNKR